METYKELPYITIGALDLTLKADPSAIKTTLTAFSRTLTASGEATYNRPLRDYGIEVYAEIFGDPVTEEEKDRAEKWLDRIILVKPFGESAVVVVRDTVKKDLCWINAGDFKKRLPMKKFKVFLAYLSGFGLNFCMIDTKRNRKMNKFYRAAGLQRMSKYLWGIRLQYRT